VSVPVRELFKVRTAWEGTVEVFTLAYHITGANRAYAWSYKSDDGETYYVAVLGVPPVNNALDAVRAYIAAQRQKQQVPISHPYRLI
jgi:hypothetical protein